jgi:hypothetical protein
LTVILDYNLQNREDEIIQEVDINISLLNTLSHENFLNFTYFTFQKNETLNNKQLYLFFKELDEFLPLRNMMKKSEVLSLKETRQFLK